MSSKKKKISIAILLRMEFQYDSQSLCRVGDFKMHIDLFIGTYYSVLIHKNDKMY